MFATLGIAWQAIKLLGIWKRIGGLFAWITASAAHLLAVGLACALLWGAWEAHGKAKAVKVQHSTETALEGLKHDYANAQATADRAAHSARAANESASAAFASAQDSANAADHARTGAAVDRYAATHRVRACGVAGSTGATVASAVLDDSGKPVAGLPAASMAEVVVSEADLRNLAHGAVQAGEWRALGRWLIDHGYAVVAPDTTSPPS